VLFYSAALEQQAATAVFISVLTLNKDRGWSLESRERETWEAE